MKATRQPNLMALFSVVCLGIMGCAEGEVPQWRPADTGPTITSDGYAVQQDGWSPRADSFSCSLSDVPLTHPHHAAICWVVTKGVMQAPGGVFSPAGTFNRALMAKHLVLLKYNGSPPQPAATPRFSDVSSSHPFFDYIQQLAADKVTVGCNVAGTKFCPTDTATNAHGASLLVRMKANGQPFTLQSVTAYFVDVPSTHWGFRTIQKLHEDKADVPCGSSTFCPDSPITRARWAAEIYRYFGP